MDRIRLYHFSPFAYLILTACGGGGGSSSQNLQFGGNIIKGPLSNATVFVDYDGDGILYSGEPSTKTDSNGAFTLTSTSSTAQIVATTDANTIDTSTGQSLAGVILKAPAGSKVVTPATTLIQETGMTSTEVADALGLTGVDLLNFNPFAAGADAATALKVEKVAQQIIATAISISTAAESSGASSLNAINKSFGAIADLLKNKSAASPLDFTNTADLNAIKTSAIPRQMFLFSFIFSYPSGTFSF